MCGICCVFTTQTTTENLVQNKLSQLEETLRKRGPDGYQTFAQNDEKFSLAMGASVLWLRGPDMITQPYTTDYSAFIYNGDVYNDDTGQIPGYKPEMGDTVGLSELLTQNAGDCGCLSAVKGPYAFVYFDRVNFRLYFARDPFGRRSLLVGKSDGCFILSSVGKRWKGFEFFELPVFGVYCFDLKTKKMTVDYFHGANWDAGSKLTELEVFLGIPIYIKNGNAKHVTKTPFTQPTALFLSMFEDLSSATKEEILENLLKHQEFTIPVNKLILLLKHSVEVRISKQPPHCQLCLHEKKTCSHAQTAILFSGGVDCAILALLAHFFTDPSKPIDLINVAFEKQGHHNTPDRLTGVNTHKELQKICPERNWNFIAVDVSENELMCIRQTRIADLIHPLKTVLDDSLGCALWFAGRAKSEGYTSTARVLLSGMGADELFGGYRKHRYALRLHGWFGLRKALEDDWSNLPYRNLGRDDRVIADNGRQLRLPYLDEEFVAFARKLHCWQRTFPVDGIPEGVGEKILLRCLAYSLGLKEAAVLKKRAFQFGSRIANSKENANDVSPRLLDTCCDVIN